MTSSSPIPGLFYSGFLTENGDRRIEPIASATDTWGQSVPAFVGPHANLDRLHWKSVPFGKIMPTVDQINQRKVGIAGAILGHNVENWRQAIKVADAEADGLAAWLDARIEIPQLLIGHSLGARIVLKAAIKSKHQHVHVVALAPALSVSEFDMTALDSPHRSIDVFFSPTDYVLGVAYPVGQSATKENGEFEVLGRLGLPEGVKPPKNIHLHDTNKLLKRKDFGHKDYAIALPELAKHSQVLHRLGRRGDSIFSRIFSGSPRGVIG